MKKIIGLTTLMMTELMLVSYLSGCGSQNQAENETISAANETVAIETAIETATQAEIQTEEASESIAEGFYFETNSGIRLEVDADMDELLSDLGEAKSVFEAESCAGQGTAYIYNYGSFEVETYPLDDKNLIAYVILKDDTVSTVEGIDLSCTKDDVISVYGNDYTETDNMISYIGENGAKLNFVFEGDELTSIEYVTPILG